MSSGKNQNTIGCETSTSTTAAAAAIQSVSDIASTTSSIGASSNATSTSSIHSTVSEFLRKLIPQDKWNVFFPPLSSSEEKERREIPNSILRVVVGTTERIGYHHDDINNAAADEEVSAAADFALTFDPIEHKSSFERSSNSSSGIYSNWSVEINSNTTSTAKRKPSADDDDNDVDDDDNDNNDDDDDIIDSLQDLQIIKKIKNAITPNSNKKSSNATISGNNKSGSGKRNKQNDQRQRQQQSCKNTTKINHLYDRLFWLFVLCIILTIILIIMAVIILPFRNKTKTNTNTNTSINNNNNNNNNLTTSLSISNNKNEFENNQTTSTTIMVDVVPSSPSLPSSSPPTIKVGNYNVPVPIPIPVVISNTYQPSVPAVWSDNLPPSLSPLSTPTIITIQPSTTTSTATTNTRIATVTPSYDNTPSYVPSYLSKTKKPMTTTTTTATATTYSPSFSPTVSSSRFSSITVINSTITTTPMSPTTAVVVEERIPPEVKDKLQVEDTDTGANNIQIETTLAPDYYDRTDDDDDDNNEVVVPPLEMGPMIGHTTHESVTLWAYHGTLLDYTMEILLYSDGGNNDNNNNNNNDSNENENESENDAIGSVLRKYELVHPNRDRNNAMIATITGLEPVTKYKYVMYIQGTEVGTGSFRTAPPSTTTTTITEAVLSTIVVAAGQSNNTAQQQQQQQQQQTVVSSNTQQRQQGLNNNNNKNNENNRTNSSSSSSRNSSSGIIFDYILVSCMDRTVYKSQRVWQFIQQTVQPHFALLAGDTIYLQENVDVNARDGVLFERYWYRNQIQRNEEYFQTFIRNVPIYSTWNNHDYGSEWYPADRTQKGKYQSLHAWKSLWPNPGYNNDNDDDDANANDKGVYYSYYWSDDVHYIVTDDHWYRDPSKENRWGTTQTEWIETELLKSDAKFKIIVMGSDIMERGWNTDLVNIGTIVRTHKINGVLFHAGDIHRNEYKRVTTGGFPYPVTQITSSGVAKVWRRPFVHIRVDTTVDDPTISAFFYGATSKTANELDSNLTWKNDPTLLCDDVPTGNTDDVTRTKEHTCTTIIRLSDLSVF